MKKNKGKYIIEDLYDYGVMPSEVKQLLDDEIDKHLEEELQKKEEKNNQKFSSFNINFDIRFTKEKLELSLANFTF